MEDFSRPTSFGSDGIASRGIDKCIQVCVMFNLNI